MQLRQPRLVESLVVYRMQIFNRHIEQKKNPPKSSFSSQRNAVHRGRENYPEQNVGKNDIKEKEGDFAMNNIEATQCTQMD